MKLMLASYDINHGYIDEKIYNQMLKSKYCLISFFYMQPYLNKQHSLDDYFEQKNAEDNLILDSGAYSMFSQGHGDLEKYIEEYIEFINNRDIKRYIELDIDSLIGYEKVKEIRKYLEQSTGKRCIPVWHRSLGIEEYKRMVDEYDYIAIGGIQNEIGRKNFDKFVPMNKYAKKRGVKVHGLAFTGRNCHKYGFYSVDSSTWTIGRRYGVAVEFRDGAIRNIKKPKGVRADYNTIVLNNLNAWLKFQSYVEYNKEIY